MNYEGSRIDDMHPTIYVWIRMSSGPSFIPNFDFPAFVFRDKRHGDSNDSSGFQKRYITWEGINSILEIGNPVANLILLMLYFFLF